MKQGVLKRLKRFFGKSRGARLGSILPLSRTVTLPSPAGAVCGFLFLLLALILFPTGLKAQALPTISINDVSVTEGTDATASFQVTLSVASVDTVTVNYATAAVTARQTTTGVYPADYTTKSGTLTFNPGVTMQTITVNIADDTVDEADQTFRVNLTVPVNATIADSIGTATILDNDAVNAVLSFTGPCSPTETTLLSIGKANVTPSPITEQTVSVDYLIEDGSATGEGDYTTVGGVRSGTRNLSFLSFSTLPVAAFQVRDNNFLEPTEEFTVTISNPVNATLSGNATSLTKTCTITDNDTLPGISIADVSTNETAGTAAFTVSLTAAYSEAVTVGYTTTAGGATAADFTAVSGTLTIAASSTTGTISVPILGDMIDEPDETFTITLSNPVNGIITDATGTGTIQNSLPSLVTLSSAATEIAESSGSATIKAQLSRANTAAVTVVATFGGTATLGTDFNRSTASIVIPAGQTESSLTISAVSDATDEADETVIIAISSVTNGFEDGDQQVTLTLTDDDESTSAEEETADETADAAALVQCEVTGVDLATNETVCDPVVPNPDGTFQLDCPDSVVSDNTVQLAVMTTCDDGLTLGKFVEADTTTGTSATLSPAAALATDEDGDPVTVAIGDIDVNETYALEMIRQEMGEQGWEAVRGNATCLANFGSSYFNNASADSSASRAVAGSIRDLAECFMRERVAPSDFGFPDFGALLSAPMHRELTAAEIDALALGGSVHCGLSEETLRERLTQSASILGKVRDFAFNLASDADLCGDRHALKAYAVSLQALEPEDFSDDSGFESKLAMIERTVTSARERGTVEKLHDWDRQRILRGAWDQLDPTNDSDELTPLLGMVEGMDLEGWTDTALRDFGKNLHETLQSSVETISRNPGLYGGLFAAMMEQGTFSTSHPETNLQQAEEAVEVNTAQFDECYQRLGTYSDCAASFVETATGSDSTSGFSGWETTNLPSWGGML